MLDLGLLFVTSLLLGMRHATDADHIVAVSTIACRERSAWRASAVGALWGLGHTLTILVVGGAIVLFKMAFTPRVGLSLELTVPVMLMVLGVVNLLNVQWKPGPLAGMRPFVVGVVHGLAGSAAVTLLILPLIENAWWATCYLLVFGAGTIAGMTLITFAMAAPAAYAASRLGGVQRWVRLASGAVSLIFGAYLGYRIGFVNGLFTDAPRWITQ
jgi:high-affinity nickel-transport protein